ncbi:MAG: PAS domain S-box protein [Dehalococcoidia bacterium]
MATVASTPDESAEARLHNRMELLFAHTTEAMVITDGLGRVLAANEPMLRLVRLSLETLQSIDIASLLVGGDAENIEIRRHRIEHGFSSGETTLRLGGQLVPVRFWTIEVQLQDGQRRAYIGATPTDESLDNARMAQVLRAHFDDYPDGKLVINQGGWTIYANDRHLELWGLTRSDLTLALPERAAKRRSRFLDPEPFDRMADEIARDPTIETSCEARLKAGVIVEVRSIPLFGDDGRTIGRSYTTRDITAARQAEAILRESEERYRTLVATLPIGVVMQYADGTIGAANTAAQRILGLTEERLLGLTSFDPRWRAIREDGAEFPREQHPAVVTLRTGEPCRDVAMGVYHVSGSLRWLNVNSEPLRDESGATSGVVVTFQDVTEQRQAEAALSRARTAEAYQTLASGVAHKINNSLTTILGNAYLARLPGGLSTDSVESLDEIVQAASAATALVRDLLALSGRERHARVPLALSDAVAGALDGLDQAERSNTTTHLNSELPAILANATAIQQAIGSIIRNGIEAGGPVTVTTDRLSFTPNPNGFTAPARPPAGEYLAVIVRDSGPGLAEEVKSRLFEPFVTTKFAGRGLGLAATSGIMSMHHGFVELVSAPDGCTATLLFPAP